MNHVTLIGRLCDDPDVRYTQQNMCVARYRLAVDRQSKDGKREADFINCVAWDKRGEFAEKYLHRGMKIAVEGSIRTGSYTDRDGKKVYTTDVWVQSHEFCESRGEQQTAPRQEHRDPEPQYGQPNADGFMSIPDDVDGEGLPWN